MRLVVVDDHLAFGEALARALAPPHRVLDVLGDGEALLPWLGLNEVEAVLLDTTLPRCNIQRVIRDVRRIHPRILLVAMSIYDDHGDWPILHRFGAHGVVSKTRTLYDILMTLDAIAAQGIPLGDNQEEILSEALTPRQADVVVAIARDRLHKEIALDLQMSEARVDEHVAEIKKRLGVRTIAAVVLRAVEEGWIEPRVAPLQHPDRSAGHS